jgi:hypothetical protein
VHALAWAIDNNLTRRVSGGDAVTIAGVKGLVAGSVNLSLALLPGRQPARRRSPGVGGRGRVLRLRHQPGAFRRRAAQSRHARAPAPISRSLPFFGAALALLLLRESPSSAFWVAAALMALGVWLHLTERHEHAHVHEPMEHTHPHVHDEHHQHATPSPGTGASRTRTRTRIAGWPTATRTIPTCITGMITANIGDEQRTTPVPRRPPPRAQHRRHEDDARLLRRRARHAAGPCAQGSAGPRHRSRQPRQSAVREPAPLLPRRRRRHAARVLRDAEGREAKGDRDCIGNMQHVSFAVSEERFSQIKKTYRESELSYLGPINVGCDTWSIYFYDPNGIRLEFSHQE